MLDKRTGNNRILSFYLLLWSSSFVLFNIFLFLVLFWCRLAAVVELINNNKTVQCCFSINKESGIEVLNQRLSDRFVVIQMFAKVGTINVLEVGGRPATLMSKTLDLVCAKKNNTNTKYNYNRMSRIPQDRRRCCRAVPVLPGRG